MDRLEKYDKLHENKNMTKYWFIVAGLIVLGMAAFALVRSQYQMSSQQNVTTTAPTPTSSQAVAAEEIPLTIFQPTKDAIVTTAQIVVRGKTKAGAEVFINDKDTTAERDGNFSASLTLDEGENLIIVTTNDAEGNMAEQELTVTVNASE